jgi:hypothetical protein
MEYPLMLVGLGVSLGGALVVALADAWLSRLMLMYLDAIEANMVKLLEAVRTGATQVDATGIDLKRDHRQNMVRAVKTLGWMALALSFGLQLAACLTGSPSGHRAKVSTETRAVGGGR